MSWLKQTRHWTKEEHFCHYWQEQHGQSPNITSCWRRVAVIVPVQTLLSWPEMVNPGSQEQWVVPWTWLHLDAEDARVRGNEDAAAAPELTEDVFAIVTKTERFGFQLQVNCYVCSTGAIGFQHEAWFMLETSVWEETALMLKALMRTTKWHTDVWRWFH